MWVRIGILCCLAVILLGMAAGEDAKKDAVHNRVKRAFFKHRKGVVHRIIDDHHDDHDDYQDFNFFGRDYDSGYGGDHDYHGGDDHGDDYHGDYHDDYHGDYDDHDDHDYTSHYDHYDGHNDDHYDDGYHGTFNDYVHESSHGKSGHGKRQSYKVVPKKKGYRKIYKPRVVVIQKIVPISTTTMPTG